MTSHGLPSSADIGSRRAGPPALHRTLGMARYAHHAGVVLGKLDAGDIAGFVSHFHENASFRFGAQPAVHGLAAIIDHVRDLLAPLASIRHRIHRQLTADDLVIVFGQLLRTTRNGRTLTTPFCHTWRLSSGYTIVDVQIYCDRAPSRHGKALLPPDDVAMPCRVDGPAQPIRDSMRR